MKTNLLCGAALALALAAHPAAAQTAATDRTARGEATTEAAPPQQDRAGSGEARRFGEPVVEGPGKTNDPAARGAERVELRPSETGITAVDRTGTSPPASPQGATTDTALGQMTADQLIGRDVVNAAGEDVGDIADLVLDRGDIVFAIVSVGGFVGIGDKEIAVPFDRLRMGRDQAILMSEASKEELERLPEFERSEDWRALPRERAIADR